MAAGARQINMGILLPIANYSEFIFNQYQEVGQKSAHTAMLKNIVFLLINAPEVMQNMYNEPLFVPILQGKKSVKFCISLCFRDC